MQFKPEKYLKIIVTSISLLLAPTVNAININNVAGGVTTNQMMTALSGSGVTVTNLTVTNVAGCNSTQGVGLFTNGVMGGAGPVLSEPTGVVISSGAITGGNRLDSSNDSRNVLNTMCGGRVSDVDMRAIEGQVANGEYAAIEFDVVPDSATLAIPFQFGSDEFPEYVCSAFNDIVGIFVSGPNINGPFSGGAENYAKTSGGDLSSINWVNTGAVGSQGNAANCGSLLNTAFYTDNSNGDPNGGNATVALTNTNLEMDGFTNTLFQPITVIAGATYHVKIAVADAGDLSWDSAAFIHPLFSTETFSGFDYGDAPNSYGTLTSNGGPSHGVDSSIYIGGSTPDSEVTGIPTVDANGDDLDGTDDEDGIANFPVLLSSDSTYSINVNVTNNSGNSARLVGWIDFNLNGTFEPAEGAQATVANGSLATNVNLNWPSLTGLVAGKSYARLRFSSDLNLSVSTPGSAMSDGEVEDYTLPISGLTFTKYVSTNGSCTDAIQAISVAAGTTVYYCYTVTNPNASAFTLTSTTDDQGLDFSALEMVYAAGASNTVIVPVIAGNTQLPTGVTTVNIAQVTANISGNNIIASDTASVTVILPAPASGVKQLYFDAFDTASPDLTRDPTNAITETRTGTLNVGSSVTLNQAINFQTPFTLSGGNDVVVQVRARSRNGGGSRTLQAQLFNDNGGAQIGTTVSTSWNANGWQTIQIPVNIPSDINLNAGDSIGVILTGTAGGNMQLSTFNAGIKSQLQIQTNTVINTDSISVYKEPYPSTLQLTSYEPGSTVYIRAVVSDPFGSADITAANLTITDANTTTPVNNQAMPLVPTATTASSKTFEYIYNIPPAPDGFWTINVTANEGLEGTISHTRSTTMIVGTVAITVNKSSEVIFDPISSSNYKAIPGAIVEYTVNINNAGFGYADNNSVVVADPIPVGTTLFFGQNPPVPLVVKPVDFIDGAAASGLNFTLDVIDLGNTTDDVEFYNMGGSVLVTPTYDANGFDTTTPPIDFIRINPKGEFMGSDGTTNPSLQLKFRVRID